MGKVFSVRQLLAAFSPELVSRKLYAWMSLFAFACAVSHIKLACFFLALLIEHRWRRVDRKKADDEVHRGGADRPSQEKTDRNSYPATSGRTTSKVQADRGSHWRRSIGLLWHSRLPISRWHLCTTSGIQLAGPPADVRPFLLQETTRDLLLVREGDLS